MADPLDLVVAMGARLRAKLKTLALG